LNPERWRIEVPPAGTRKALAVQLPKPLDHALAQRLIEVIDPAGAAISGIVELSDGECRWTFVPGKSWRAGTHQLAIQVTLEDLAGNNVGKPFDVDLFESVSQRVTNCVEKLTFFVR
jgi:hypothetical protein